jgi:hypothetical protein
MLAECKAGTHWSVADTPCPACGMKQGSNRGRCVKCWDDYADFQLGCYLDRWADGPDFQTAAVFFLERHGSMLAPA